MLADRDRELLSAYVDGELDAAQRRSVRRLLRRSTSARKLVRQLQADAARLRDLPRYHLPRDFADQVLQQLPTRPPYAAPRPVPGARRWWSQPVGVSAAAAALLLAVLAGSYAVFSGHRPGSPDQPVAQAQAPEDVETPGKGEAVPEPPERVSNPSPPVAKKPAAPAKREREAVPTTVAEQPSSPSREPAKVVPEKEPADQPELAAPLPNLEMFQPNKVDIAMPAVFTLRDLNPTQLRDELKKDSGFRIELTCRESVRALERLQGVFKEKGIHLLIDQSAQARLKVPQMRTHFVVLLESLTAAEWTDVLRQLGQEDRREEKKKKGTAYFDGLVVSRMSKEDRRELAGLLGVDPRQFQVPANDGPFGLDPRKPLSEVTGDQVAKTLSGQGASAKPANHQGLVMAFNPVRPRPGSAEVKRFLDARRPPPKGAIQVLLVVRETAR